MLPSIAQRMGVPQQNLMFIGLLLLGHFTIDLHQGALPAIFPELRETMGLTYGQLGLILAAFSLTSSFAQPVFGLLSDRTRFLWFIPAGIVLAPLGMAIIGLAPSYGVIIAAVILQGIGSAAYHPEAIRTTADISGERKATAMAVWMLGGNLGLALGPLYVAFVLLVGDLRGIVWSAPLGIAVAALTIMFLGRMATRTRLSTSVTRAQAQSPSPPATNWRGQILAVLTVVIRTAAQNGIVVFLPFYYVQILGGPAGHEQLLQAALLFGAAFGGIIGGSLADRLGPKPVIMGSYAVMAPLMLLLMFLQGPALFVSLFIIGATQTSVFVLATVLGQQFMPRHASMAAALTNGVALGIGGALVGLLGMVADLWGVGTALAVVVVMPIPGLIVAYFIPAARKSLTA